MGEPAAPHMPRATAVAIASTCCDAGVPELISDLLLTAASAHEASERIVAAVAAKTVVPFPVPQPSPFNAKIAPTTDAATAIVRDRLISNGAQSDWPLVDQAG